MRFVIILLTFVWTTLCVRQQMLRSTRMTNWGDWYDMEHCWNSSYANGMQIKYQEPSEEMKDNTALNGVRLYCNALKGGHKKDNFISSSGVGQFGDWQPIQWCPKGQVIVGFSLRSQPPQINSDNVAAVNLAAFCDDPYGERDDLLQLEGDTDNWGDWSEAQICPPGYAVCGIAAQVQSAQNDGDDTSLNNIDVDCCQL